MNKEQIARAEQNKANELERLEKIRKLCNKLTDQLHDRLSTKVELYAGYLNGRIVICEGNSIVADIWHGYFHQLTEMVVIPGLCTDEMEIVFELCKLTDGRSRK